MRKYTQLGEMNKLQKIAIGFMKTNGFEVSEIDELVSNKFMMKTIIAMGDLDIQLLREILPKVRTFVYVGNNEEVKSVIAEYVAEKDIPLAMNKESIAASIDVWYNDVKTIEVYSSSIYSELELVNKFICVFGPKIQALSRLISQVELNRDTAPFDHLDLRQIEMLHEKFMEYFELKEMMDSDELIEIYNMFKP